MQEVMKEIRFTKQDVASALANYAENEMGHRVKIDPENMQYLSTGTIMALGTPFVRKLKWH